MDPASIDVVLVRPSRAANVAASCRAMKNMGLRSLRLVEPVPRLDEPGARNLAYGAWDVLDGAARHPDLRSAVEDATMVVATSGREDPGAWSPRRLAAEVGSLARGGRVSLVFGPEASGLRTHEIGLCHLRVHVPTDPAQPSLNLAQAVLLLAYELRLSGLGPDRPLVPPLAAAGAVEAAVQGLRQGLLDIGYLNPQDPDSILTELRGLILRARPTPREVELLRGVARQLAWAGGRIARSRERSG